MTHTHKHIWRSSNTACSSDDNEFCAVAGCHATRINGLSSDQA